MDMIAIKMVDSIVPEEFDVIDVTSFAESFDMKLARGGLHLDLMIYMDKRNVDVVCVVKGNDLNMLNLKQIAEHLPKASKTIYFANGDTSGSFFCRPHILTLVSDMYKMKSGPEQTDSDASHNQRLLYLMERIDITFGKF